MNKSALGGLAALGAVAALFAGCGDGDRTDLVHCEAGRARCLTDMGGEVCASDGSSLLPFDCDDGEECGENADGEVGCLGSCAPLEKQCVSERASRVCAEDGKLWINIVCGPGTGCDGDRQSESYGECVRTDMSVTVCEPRETECVDTHTLKTCELDGSNWVYSPCRPSESCEGDRCAVDDGVECVPNTGTCLSRSVLHRCAADGSGFEQVECSAPATCLDGACRGPVCTADEVRCDDRTPGNEDVLGALVAGSYEPAALYTCNASGTAWERSLCSSERACVYDGVTATAVSAFLQEFRRARANGAEPPRLELPEGLRASCELPECAAPYALRELSGEGEPASPGSFACGNVLSSEPASLDSYSLCEGLLPYQNLHWANYACAEGELCAYRPLPGTSATIGPACSRSCVPGAVSCFSLGSPAASGEATITCGEHGSWDYASVSPCEARGGERERWCGPNLSGDGAPFSSGRCLDPACFYWQAEFGTFAVPDGYGACRADGAFRQCRANGTFAATESCGHCTRVVSAGIEDPTWGGLPPGRCEPLCEEGAQRCVLENDQSPYYETCLGGGWTQSTCSGGANCWEVFQPGVPEAEGGEIRCGAECVPRSASCSGKQIVRCSDAGILADPEPCAFGVCSLDELTGDGSANCEAECVNGTEFCAPELGGLVACASGRFGAPVACPSGTACEPGHEELGCVECRPNTTDCVNETDIRICTAEGAFSVPIRCANGACNDGACSTGGQGGMGGAGMGGNGTAGAGTAGGGAGGNGAAGAGSSGGGTSGDAGTGTSATAGSVSED